MLLSRITKWIALLAIPCLLIPSEALAQVTKKDVQTIVRTISFVEGGPGSTITMDIIGSGPDADTIRAIIGDGLQVGKLYLQVKNGDNGSPVAYISNGSERLAPALNNRRVITVSTNLDCAISGPCVIAVSTVSGVQIHVNSAAAAAANVRFVAAFRMMIKEH